MYLKEIKISGFKSFADKINLSLDNDITCVVGPNGSGKSNIVDAVKWVLGEQSIKSLRGSNNMTDVIFSGSKSRNPLNLASVTLVFDNSDSYLKVPYTEISVTRKVYRSGENEYFINNEKCRLKDISDLFLDSGMGKYAFNIISQGEVSKIISDSSQERRAIFEEAAGVLKYKKRKEEALKKLDKTNENLTRAKDITNELEVQLEPLKEQSDKAKEYLEAKKSLEQVEIALIASDLDKLNIKYKENESKIESIQNDIVEQTSKTATGDVELENKTNELNKINELLVELNNKNIELSKQEEKINGEKNIINERSKYNAEDMKVHENITSLTENKLTLNNKLLSLKTDINILSTKLKGKDSEINEINKKLSNKRVSKNNIESQISTLKYKINDLEFKIKSLNDYIEQGGGISASVKNVLSNPKLRGVHNIISKLIDIDEKYSLALDVALGGAREYVVVDSPEDAKRSINYLKDNNLGRVTFYPLNVIKPRYIDEDTLNVLKREKGFIDILAGLTSFDSKYHDVIYNQLGNVILVDNIDTANEISKKINNRYRIITLSGEVINVGGSITGGTIKKRSLINDKYDLQRMTIEKDNLSVELSSLEDKLIKEIQEEKSIGEEIFNIQREKLVINEEITNKESSYEQIRKDYERIDLELSNLKDLTSGTIEEEYEKITNKYYDVLNKKESLLKQISLVNEQKEKLSSEIEHLQADYRLQNTSIRNLEQELKTQEIENTKIGVKIDNLLNILSESYSLTFEKARANYVLEIDENLARKNVNSLRSEIKRLGDVNTGAIEEYDRVSTRYDFLMNQITDLEKAMETLLNIIDELDDVMKREFIKTFKEIEIEFNNVFKELFSGGSAKLRLSDEDNILESGIDIIVTPPGKKVSTISLLSGGEKTLAAISLLFAILNVKGIPFCIFDEVEAALDEANVDKVGAYFKKYTGKTQLIIITHKKKTMEYAKTLYGITMQESGVSKLVSVKLID